MLLGAFSDLAHEVYPALSYKDAYRLLGDKACLAQVCGDLQPLIRDLKTGIGREGVHFLASLEDTSEGSLDTILLRAFVDAGKLEKAEGQNLRQEIMSIKKALGSLIADGIYI